MLGASALLVRTCLQSVRLARLHPPVTVAKPASLVPTVRTVLAASQELTVIPVQGGSQGITATPVSKATIWTMGHVSLVQPYRLIVWSVLILILAPYARQVSEAVPVRLAQLDITLPNQTRCYALFVRTSQPTVSPVVMLKPAPPVQSAIEGRRVRYVLLDTKGISVVSAVLAFT